MSAIAETVATEDTFINKVKSDLDFPLVTVDKLYGTFEVDGQTRTFNMPGRKALYRPDIDKTITVATTGYTVLEHKRAVEQTLEAFDKRNIHATPHKFYLHPDGRRMFLHFKTDESYTINALNGDIIQMETILSNSYDLTGAYGMELGGDRLICKNGMRGYRKDFGVSRRHFHMDSEKVVAEFFQMVDRFHNDFMPMFALAYEAEISQKDALELVTNLGVALKYQKLITQNVYQQSEITGTVWGLYNAITAVASHNVRSYMVRREMELRAFQMVRNQVH